MSYCTKCGVEKSDEEFYVRKTGRLHSWCISCLKELRIRRNPEIAEYQRKKREERTEKEKEMGKNYQLQYNFGISLSEYNNMLEEQGYRCAICDKQHLTDKHDGERVKGLSVDHDHVTGVVRGLLCNDCNRAMGQLKDSPALLRKAADYLEYHTKRNIKAKIDSDILLDELMKK